MKSPARASHVVAVLSAGTVLLGSGCARLVTLDPQVVTKQNDEAWNVRASPSPSAIASTPVVPLPMRKRNEAQVALRSPPDSLGIPAGLYAVDPLLSAHRREMDSQASARHAVAAGAIVVGLIGGGISAWSISVGNSHLNDPRSDTQSSAAQAIAYGSILGVLCIGEIIAGTVLALTSSDPAPLQSYYRETYSEPR